jgi:hypothetical protein
MKRLLALAILFLPAMLAAGTLQLYVIDAEHGNAVPVVGPSGQSMLIDWGPPGREFTERMLAAMKDAGVKQLDHAVISHYHWDHFGTIPELAEKVPILDFVDHGAVAEHDANESAKLTAADRTIAIENGGIRLEFDGDAAGRLTDRRSGEVWDLQPPAALIKGKGVVTLRPTSIRQEAGAIRFSADPGIEWRVRLLDNPAAVEFSYSSAPEIDELLLLSRSLAVEAGSQDYYAVPHRLGNLLFAEGDKPVARRMRPYGRGGYSMAMYGVVKHGSALLVTWEDPYTEIIVDYAVEPVRRITSSISLRRSARSFRIQPLGRGGYVEISKAYRPMARERGLLRTLAEKMRDRPAAERFFGAADFKPFAFIRRMPNTRFNNTDKETLTVNFTFDECARLAEHFKNDLGIDRALLVLNGWINGGYDVRHPDILPAAPEIGGDAGLAECRRRVKALGGWSFGLHDNYQDFYRDAPSWDEKYIMRSRDGSLVKGGVWFGGQAYFMCSRKALEIASRPANVPGVRDRFAPDLYFSDTIFAVPPQECFAPDHLLARNDDIHYKQQLCDYIRREIGLFGSEEGMEWGLPHADYFEGILSHKTGYQRLNDVQWTTADIIVPMFEMVYGDAIPMYTHQSDRPRPDNPAHILDLILYAEMPVYYFGNHQYWTDAAQEYQPAPGSDSRLVFARGGRHGLIDQFIKNTYEVLSPLNRLTALMPMTGHRFLTTDRKVEASRFGEDVSIMVNFGASDYETANATLPQWGFLVESPTLTAFYARRHGDRKFSEPTLMVLQSLDGKPLKTSGRVRLYRAFGDRRVRVGARVEEVETEKVIARGMRY